MTIQMMGLLTRLTITMEMNKILMSSKEIQIDSSSEGLKNALHSAESMRNSILEMLYTNSYIRLNGEKRVKVKVGEKHYAEPFKIVIKNSHATANGANIISTTEAVFKFPNSHTVCIDLLMHHTIEKLNYRGCLPLDYLTEHLTASFKYGKNDSSHDMLKKRSLSQIEVFLVNASSPLGTF